ncbi:MAG: YifB family Mg chelatase-like AAA ATPase [Clostridia bacterium]|nr:YifB family Mg chelatase-like AAA ATPase [Clostridia bacterium]
MVSKINSCGISGIEGRRVLCECDLAGGLPRFDVVGLPDASVKESKDRVSAAIKNCGFRFPMKHITVNLAPGEMRKEGPVYDLPILAGLLCASEQLPPPGDDAGLIGELSLEGEVRPVSGMLPMAAAAREAGLRRLFVPADNAEEAALAGGLEIYPVRHVSELAAHLRGEELITPAPPYSFSAEGRGGADFSEVMGQESIKRPLEIAAAGSHNILMIGPPGSGKSMLAKRLPSILPDMTWDEALETTKIYSVAGLTGRDSPLISVRPFRSPHHTVSAIGLTGGGMRLRPGEISLAHNGVLFLDELPEFRRDALEVLRQPIEDGVVTISRVSGTCSYPSRFMLVCAMNPCPCGYFGHPSGKCTCTDQAIRGYRKRISGPLLDRIDLHVNVPSVPYESLRDRKPAESSERIRERVNAARERQMRRFAGSGVSGNAYLTSGMMQEHCRLDASAQKLMGDVFERMGLSARAHDRILKVARTIADLAGCEDIRAEHVAEAVQYRTLDREYLI